MVVNGMDGLELHNEAAREQVRHPNSAWLLLPGRAWLSRPFWRVGVARGLEGNRVGAHGGEGGSRD